MCMMTRIAAMTVALMLGAQAQAIELDPKIVGFKLPADIKWNENTRSGNRTAILQGDPTKPGPYAMLLTWLPGNMSRPHFHPNDRFFMVLSGTWWVGNGGKFDTGGDRPDAGRHPRDPLGEGRALRRREDRAGDDPGVGRRPGDEHAIRCGGGDGEEAVTHGTALSSPPPERGRSTREACRVGVIFSRMRPPPQPSPFQGEGADRVRGTISTSRACAP